MQDALPQPQASELHIFLFQTHCASFFSPENLGYGRGELPLFAISYPRCRQGAAYPVRTGEESRVDVGTGIAQVPLPVLASPYNWLCLLLREDDLHGHESAFTWHLYFNLSPGQASENPLSGSTISQISLPLFSPNVLQYKSIFISLPLVPRS